VGKTQNRRALLARLTTEGLPIPRIMDTVSDHIPNDVGLSEVSIDKTGLVHIAGEATDNKQIIALLKGLKSSALLTNTSLESLDSSQSTSTDAPSGLSKVVRFQVVAQVQGVKQSAKPSLPGE
jgi:Tfp pilus assembly protein PilN